MEKYEIVHVSFPGYHFESEIGTLTGLEFDEIRALTNDVKRWAGRTYIEIFRKLGFSCNPRFVKFDKDTPYPCLMRCKSFDRKDRFWYGFVYYDGKIYGVRGEIWDFKEYTRCIKGKYYFNDEFRITSMLQVWI